MKSKRREKGVLIEWEGRESRRKVTRAGHVINALFLYSLSLSFNLLETLIKYYFPHFILLGYILFYIIIKVL